MTKLVDLFKIEDDELKKIFNQYTYPEEILPNIHDYIMELGQTLGEKYHLIDNNIWIHEKAEVSKTAEIIGPCIIMEEASIRHNAFLRGNVIVGRNCVVGNSCEIKNSILINACEVPHFNYVGDSILGYRAHLGAGVILSNLRLDKEDIILEGRKTNLRKIGAFIGDNAQIGCNTVINPGTIVYPNVVIYPLMNVKGIIKDNLQSNQIELRRL